jgi:acyl-CoA synthetase (AMP-forming)/AMP-acid ligase II
MTPLRELLELRCGWTEPALILGEDGRATPWAAIEAVSHQWRRSGLAGPVGLALSDPLDMATHVVAAVAAGVVVAPMDPYAPARDTAARAREMSLSALVTDGTGCARELDGLRLVHLGNPPDLPDVPVRPALIMASSGSTGKAKIVPLTLEQLMATAEEVVGHLGLAPGERGYSPLPLFHINCIVIGVLSALVAGSTVVLDRRFSRRAFWNRVERHGVTWLNLVPAILAILAGDTDSGPAVSAPTIRLARSASAPLPISVLERFRSRFEIPVVETYGMTEAASQITANPIDAVKPGSVGKPVGVELRVVDEDGRVAPIDALGRVQIKGRRVVGTYWAAGAHGELEARAAGDEDGWLTTGDVGRLDIDGYLHLVGREGDVINRGGERSGRAKSRTSCSATTGCGRRWSSAGSIR